MSPQAALEPSFADVLRALETATDLPDARRRHWLCSVGRIATWIDRPPESIPARWTAARFLVARLHHARIGSTAKTLANHRSNARAALLWFSKEKSVPSRGTPLRPDWARLWARLSDRRSRAILSGLMRFCSAKGVPPDAVTETVIDEFFAYRGATTALAVDDAARRSIARVWNGCSARVEGWRAVHLIEPPVKAFEGPAWVEFPQKLRADIEDYVTGLTRAGRRGRNGKRLARCKASTVHTRRAELIAVARMAVRIGMPIENLSSLAAVVEPAMVEKVIEAYWKKDGDEPKVFTIDLASKLLAVARAIGTLDAAGLARLEDIREALEQHRRSGMTEKNLKLIRQVLSDNVWREVVNLPRALMAQARELAYSAPVKAAVTAQVAAAIAILTNAPIRLGNLAEIELEQNLIKPGGLGSPYWLVFPGYDVKNRVDLEFALNQRVTDLIGEYVHDFRPALVRGSNTRWLFPGEEGESKTRATLSGQISGRVKKATGISITVHQFRHAAAAFYLMHRPGDYETVRRLLGHKNIQTTIRFYCSLTAIQATKLFGEVISGATDEVLEEVD